MKACAVSLCLQVGKIYLLSEIKYIVKTSLLQSRMDIQTFVISVVIFIILALLIWLITSLTVRERPFEERLEEQRKMEKELMLLGGKQAGAKKDKPKKKNKKLKGGVDGVEPVGEKVENIAKTKTTKMVELEIDPEVIETSLSEPPVTITERKGKLGKPDSPTTMRPILINKEQKSHVQKPEKATELFHRRVHKDEVELKHDREGKKADVQHKVAVAAVNGFHSESDDLPAVATRSLSEQMKAPASESKSKKHRPELDSTAGDGSVSRVGNISTEAPFSGDRQSKRKPVSNDVTVSGKVMPTAFIIATAIFMESFANSWLCTWRGLVSW